MMTALSAQEEKLLQAAKDVRAKAYAPYSGFLVGAAILTSSARIFSGCNVENSSYGLGCCAERVALFSAVAAGERNFTMLAVAASSFGFTYPCGACLQVLAEFAPRLPLILQNGQGEVLRTSVDALLPCAFHLPGEEKESKKEN